MLTGPRQNVILNFLSIVTHERAGVAVQGRCLDIASISRYLHQLAELEDVLQVEQHVGRCARCHDKLQRMRRHAEALFDDSVEERLSPHACPSLIALDHFLRGGLSERQLVRIQEHLHRCPACWQWASARELDGAHRVSPLLELLATRVPDLDLRVAPLGVRIAAGAEWLLASAMPTLAQRLELPEPPLPEPYVAYARQLHFGRSTTAGTLRGRVELFGPEGFRLSAALEDGPASQPLFLWTRLRVQTPGRLAPGVSGATWLLEPGHYFLGLCAYETPLLALSVETDFATSPSLAACGYDACRFGRFRLSLLCFERARALRPLTATYAELHRLTLEFAQSFGIAQNDGDWRWREVEPRRATLPPLPPLDVQDTDLTPAHIANLVDALARRAEASAAIRRPRHSTPRVSRRAFRAAYAEFLPRLRALLPPCAASVEPRSRTS